MDRLYLLVITVFFVLVYFDLRRILVAFKEDALAALGKQSTAIDNLAARLPQPPDPATIVPVADQQAVVGAIDANTTRIDALAPTTP